MIKANGFSYTTERVVGNGSFGVVYQATVVGTGETVAIKKVLQDRKYKVPLSYTTLSCLVCLLVLPSCCCLLNIFFYFFIFYFLFFISFLGLSDS